MDEKAKRDAEETDQAKEKYEEQLKNTIRIKGKMSEAAADEFRKQEGKTKIE